MWVLATSDTFSVRYSGLKRNLSLLPDTFMISELNLQLHVFPCFSGIQIAYSMKFGNAHLPRLLLDIETVSH